MQRRDSKVSAGKAAAHWQHGPVAVWQLPHVPGTRGEPQARQCLGGALDWPPQDLPIVRDAKGRPELTGALAHLGTGWTHSGSHLLVALGEGIRLGVDLERICTRPRMREVIARFFHPDEVTWLLALDEDACRHWFFRVWCAKEAILKCHGQGISYGLHRFALAPRDGVLALVASDAGLGPAARWQLREWTVGADFRAALAWHPA